VNNLRSLMSATLLALAFAAPSVRAADETPNPWKFEFHGVVSASMYSQNQAFANGQGQGLLYSAPAPGNMMPCKADGLFTCPATPVTKSGNILSGDIRNSRFSFAMSGPKVFGDAQPRAYLEFDLFGPNGFGAFGSEQNIPRIRAAIVELKSGNTTIQVGQQNQLVVQQIISSLGHLSNPVSYGAGTIAWRTPGIRLTQVVPLDAMKLTLAIEAVKNKWSNEAANSLTGGATTPAGIGQGEASGMPMIQAMARIDGTGGPLKFTGYLVGAYHSVKLDGFGAGTPPATSSWAYGKKSIDGNVIEVGGNVTFAPVNFAFNFYTGKSTGNMLGSLLYFGDIKDTGYWGQLAGYFTKELSLSLAYGAGKPNKDDVKRINTNPTTGVILATVGAARLENQVMGGMLKYQDGGYAIGLEAWQNTTKWSTWTATVSTETNTSALQVMATANYNF
jgi:hypothetical protein